MKLSDKDAENLRLLEESLWRTETRFDLPYMEGILADDFFEFGRSGRFYQRRETLDVPKQQIHATLPLHDFKARLLDTNIAQVTYISIVAYDTNEERALRNSIWSRNLSGWQLRFHQGTAL